MGLGCTFTALRGSQGQRDVDQLWKIPPGSGVPLLSAFEAYLVFSLARAQAKRPGDYAEVGVTKGHRQADFVKPKGRRGCDCSTRMKGCRRKARMTLACIASGSMLAVWNRSRTI